jgi:CRISPR/Cas system CSM-associated protein Csm2 small subunit
MEAGQLMVDFEKGNKMEKVEYSNVSEALETLKKLKKLENDIFEYIKIQMKNQTSNNNDAVTTTQLKEFFDYVNKRSLNEISLPNFDN